MVFNLCLGLITPPVGILLDICANFAGVKLEDEIRELGPFLGAGVAVLIIISLFPATVLWLPKLLVGATVNRPRRSLWRCSMERRRVSDPPVCIPAAARSLPARGR